MDTAFWPATRLIRALRARKIGAPIGLSPGGLPIGVNIIGPQYGDLRSIRAARLIEREYYAFVPPPAHA